MLNMAYDAAVDVFRKRAQCMCPKMTEDDFRDFVMPSLQMLRLEDNELDDAAKQTLREAVAGREGLELYV